MKEHYDVVIIGSGLGGLVSANILSREGYKVCVLEKNNQFGGNLQTFVRDKSIFDTGVHYIGGLEKGQNLYKYFTYLGIMKDLKLKKMDDAYDKITFGDDTKEYAHYQGKEKFKASLIKDFPEELTAINTYFKKIEDTCKGFPLYNLQLGSSYMDNMELLSLNTKEYLESITSNTKLKAVLAGSNLLYAGGNTTPFFVHALSLNSYIESSYKCVNGGSQIAKMLLRRIKENGGEAYKYQEVTAINTTKGLATSVTTKEGKEISGDLFISNFEPISTLKMIKGTSVRKSYFRRIDNIESVISAFSVYIVFKPNTFPYLNYNIYHTKNSEAIFNSQNYTNENWPLAYMASFCPKKSTADWAENLTVLTYMNFDDVQQWETTFNTKVSEEERGRSYEEFKEKYTEKIIVELEKKFPNIRSCIQSIHSSTPLSYRDYIGVRRGSMYGYVKDSSNPLKSFLSPKSKIKNLYFTGQSLNMHGILGVTISGVVTCSEILGKEYLLNKINEANKA